jgi:hypothetical protein
MGTSPRLLDQKMSNLLSRRWKQYYQMPCLPDAVESALSLVAFRYYAFLCREMNVRSAVELHYSNKEISLATGIKDHKTISRSRIELRDARLIDFRRVPPGVCAHIMLDQHGVAIPAPEGRRGVRRYTSGEIPKTTECNAQSKVLAAHGRNRAQTAALVAPDADTCRTHGQAPHWNRNGDLVCELCHPNPKPSEPKRSTKTTFLPPTAADLGF